MMPSSVNAETSGPLIPRFYSGRDLLITGGTGFMGKVLIERILSTCPDIGSLFLLMRDKKGQSPQKRLDQLKKSQIFDNIRNHCPQQLEKMRLLVGDVTKAQLGISYEDLGSLIRVSIVFHGAATVKFDEPLRFAVEQNVVSVEKVLDLCGSLPFLEVLVYISTAYNNVDLPHIEERVYPVNIKPAVLCGLVQSLPDDVITNITPHLIFPKPNTYTFTKAVAESVLEGQGNKQKPYSIAIFRPTIVTSSKKDPFPGWVDSFNGPTGVVVGAQKGLLHVYCCDPNCIVDLLPVDIAIDTMMAVAWEISVDRPQKPRVYNCSTIENPTTWGDFVVAMKKLIEIYPLNGSLWYPYTIEVQNKFALKILEFFLHTTPMYMMHYIVMLLRINTRLNFKSISKLVSLMVKAQTMFSTKQWYFDTANVQRLRAKLTPEDRAIFNLDPHSIDWETQYRDYVIGVRKYLLKEDYQDEEKVVRRHKRMYYLHCGTTFLALLLLTRIVFWLINICITE